MLFLLATAVSVVSVPGALATQLLIVGAVLYDRRRTRMPTVRREIAGTWVLNGEATVRLRVTGAEGEVVVTDDTGPGLRRLPPDVAGEVDASGPSGARLLRPGRTGRSEPADGAPASVGSGHVAGYRVVLRRRGDLRFGSVHVRALSPWGLVWREEEHEVEELVRVQPGIEDLRKERLPGLRPSLVTPGARKVRRWGEGSEFESLREYQRGDDPRTVDWKASARRAELLVRNYQVERNQNVVLAIDAGRLMRERIGDRERLDYALAAALLVAERARSYGDRVGVLVFDDVVRTIMPPARVRLSELADTFATVEARLVEPNYPVAFTTLGRSFRKRSLVLFFSEVIDAAASRALVAGLAGAVTRHLPVAVALRNPDVDAAAIGGVPGAGPYGRAAAEALLEARAKALQGMRRAGVHTVDVLPGAACAAALDKYSEIKRRGLL